MLARIRLFLIVVVAAAVVPPAAQAQAQPATETRSTSLAGPRRDLTATALRHFAQQDATAVELMQRRRPAGQPVALMVVGGAAVVLGALIGDDVGTVFMIGGAVALLIGLYQYLQ
jgi:hypothetical protein